MKTSISLIALAAALACAAPALAAGPYNEAQARQKVEAAGYTKISGLHENAAGDWMGQGDREGRIVMFVLDTKGAVTQTAQNGTNTGNDGTAELKVTQPAAQVTVKQAQPDVTVTQAQPTITVHQPAPIVTVEIPQPEITVHMPKPDVAVSQAQPQVQVNQPKPQVQVMAAPQAQVNVQRSAAEVTMQQDGQAPQVQYTADDAKVNVKQGAGSPTVKVVQDGDADDGANARGAAAAPKGQMAPADAAAADATPVSKITKLNVTNLHGDVLGDVERVVKNKADGRDYIVMGHGGFLGLGQKHVALPVDKTALRDGKVEMRGLTDDEIRSMKPFNDNDSAYTQLGADQTVRIPTSF